MGKIFSSYHPAVCWTLLVVETFFATEIPYGALLLLLLLADSLQCNDHQHGAFASPGSSLWPYNMGRGGATSCLTHCRMCYALLLGAEPGLAPS